MGRSTDGLRVAPPQPSSVVRRPSTMVDMADTIVWAAAAAYTQPSAATELPRKNVSHRGKLQTSSPGRPFAGERLSRGVVLSDRCPGNWLFVVGRKRY
jgi:hypothetical protein